MNRTHVLVLSVLLLLSALAVAQQNPPVAQPQPQPATSEQPAVAQPQPATPAAQPVEPAVRVSQDRAQIQSLVQQLDQAAINNDSATFDRLLAPNYQAVNPQGVREDKNTILKAHEHNDIKYESVQDRDQDIQVSGDTATERSTSDIRGVYKGQRFDGTYASTRTFQRQPDGNWQIVAFEVHRVQ